MEDTINSPAERRRIRVRGAILEAAERVFAEEGEAGLSIRRIADEIDYSPAAIYKYFESKDELVDELKEAFFGRIIEGVNAVVDPHRPFSERARACMAGYVRIALEKPHHYVAAFTGTASDTPSTHGCEFEVSNRARAFGILTGMVSEGLEGRHFRAGLDPVDTAKSVWASVHGLAMMCTHFTHFPSMATMPSDVDQDTFIGFHADNIIRGLEAGPAGQAAKPGDA